MIADYISWACIVLGGFLCITGGLGVVRFPDFFSRMHAASITDTLGGMFIILGLLIQSGLNWLVSVKLALIVLFILITSPTSGHALAKAALHAGMTPWKKSSNGDEVPNKNNSDETAKE